MQPNLIAPQINKDLLGIEHDVTVVYASQPIEKYQERLSDLESYVTYMKEYNKHTPVGAAQKSMADLNIRIERLKNIINAKESYANAEAKSVQRNS